MTGTVRIVFGSVFGAVAGFLTRPCCILPAMLSVAGVSSTGLAGIFGAHRVLFLSTGGLMLATSLWINVRRAGGSFNKALTADAIAKVITLRTSRQTIMDVRSAN